MNNKTDLILKLYDSYSNPVIKGLIQAISLPFIPIGNIADNYIESYINKIKQERMRTFFNELNDGSTILTKELIYNDDFLHAYFSILSYTLRSKSEEKIRSFARILKSLSINSISTDEFEEYSSIINELSEREILILSIKYKFEKEVKDESNNLNPAQKTTSYWDNFQREIGLRMNLSEEELDAMLMRIQRTGCYQKHVGYWEDAPNMHGDTTILFEKIYTIINSTL